MSSIHYCAAWTVCGCFISCGHSHRSVGEVVACIRVAAAYVVAVDPRTMRCLNVAEEAEFQFAVHNSQGHNAVAGAPAIAATKSIDSRYAVMTRISVGSRWTWTTWMCFPSYAKASAHAREGDKVVRFRSAEWQELRRETTVAPPSHAFADTDPAKSADETLVEFVFRLLSTVESDLELDSKAQERPINSEGSQKDETQNRKRA
jgi:hypothetical protein